MAFLWPAIARVPLCRLQKVASGKCCGWERVERSKPGHFRSLVLGVPMPICCSELAPSKRLTGGCVELGRVSSKIT